MHDQTLENLYRLTFPLTKVSSEHNEYSNLRDGFFGSK